MLWPRGVRVGVMEHLKRSLASRTGSSNASPVFVSVTATVTRPSF